jgi:hypothetical protein
MATNNNFDVNVILFKEEDNYIAHCLDFDIVAQGHDFESAKESFKKVFLCQIGIDMLNNRPPFTGWDKAPKEIWDLYYQHKDNWKWTREPLYIPDLPIRATVYSMAA